MDSPISEEIKDLIHGPIKEETETILFEDKKARQEILLEQVKCSYHSIEPAIEFLTDCYNVFDYSDIGLLDQFIVKYKECGIRQLERYAEGLERDYDAVKNSLIYKNVSNGPTEGNNGRIKMLHRRSVGRAGLDLLNAYVVLSSARMKVVERFSLIMSESL